MKINVTAEPLNIVIQDAYVRIEQVLHNRFEGDMECIARCYQSDPGFPPAMPAFKDIVFRVPFNPAAGNPYDQGYNGAKLLDTFAGATDC